MLSGEEITGKKTSRSNRLKELVHNEKLCSLRKAQKEKHLTLGENYRQRELTCSVEKESKTESCTKY